MSDHDIRLIAMKQRALGLRDLNLFDPDAVLDQFSAKDAENQSLLKLLSWRKIHATREEFLKKVLLSFPWSRKQKKIIQLLLRKKRVPTRTLLEKCVDTYGQGSLEGKRRTLMRAKSRINQMLSKRNFDWGDKVSDVVILKSLKDGKGKEHFEFAIETEKCPLIIGQKTQF